MENHPVSVLSSERRRIPYPSKMARSFFIMAVCLAERGECAPGAARGQAETKRGWRAKSNAETLKPEMLKYFQKPEARRGATGNIQRSTSNSQGEFLILCC